MAQIWADRLAEVWATPGKAGSGVVVGAEIVLTARHVVAGALDGGSILSRVVKPGAVTAGWVPMTLLAEDAAWDVALLGVDRQSYGGDGGSGSGWLKPSSLPPVFVRFGASAEHGCEAVGFPQSEVQRPPDGDPVTTVRQSEHVVGTLLSAGQAKRPVNPERPLPRRWVPLDIDEASPGVQTGWGGMSGAGVVLADGRLAGLVVDAESGHQQRRIYMVPFADVLADSGHIAETLATALDGSVVIETRDAPLHRALLQEDCLAPDGMPMRVGDASYKAFGAELAGVPGEPAFLDYVPRDADQALRDGLQRARAERRMLVVVGGSAGGKSRSAAEAVRLHLPDHRLLCPRQTALARVHELAVAEFGPAVVWLDDAQQYDERAFRDSIEWLLRSGVVVVATIRRNELEKRMPKEDQRDPLGDTLIDRELTVRVSWPVIWNDDERARVEEHVRYPALLAWVADGKSLSAWVVAGPALEAKLRDAAADDERPVRYAIVRTALDWYRTGIAQPVPSAVVRDLVSALFPHEADPAELEDALQWTFESVTGASRSTSQSLLAKTQAGDAITVHDYIQDADLQTGDRPVADEIWLAALDEADSEKCFNIALMAYYQRNFEIVRNALLPQATQGDVDAMYYLGMMLEYGRDPASEPDEGSDWIEKAAEAGNANAMVTLGEWAIDAGYARRWFGKAAEAGHTTAMVALGALAIGPNHDLYDTARKAGNIGLGALLVKDSDPDLAHQWFEKAAEAGNVDAMNLLGMWAKDSDPVLARYWFEKAAEAGNVDAMSNLGWLVKDSDPDQAQHWLEKAAKAGDVKATFYLGHILLEDTDPGEARHVFDEIAEAGGPRVMSALGKVLEDRDPEQALYWFERAADGGDLHVMFALAKLLEDRDPEQSRRWIDKVNGSPSYTVEIGVDGEGRPIISPILVLYWHFCEGEYRKAIDVGTRALAIARDTGDRSGEGELLGLLGHCHVFVGEYQEAIDLCTRALAIARDIGDRSGEGELLGLLGHCRIFLGEYQEAIDLCTRALAIAEDIGDRYVEAKALDWLGWAWLASDDPQRAVDLLTQAAAAGDIETAVTARSGLARAQLQLGDLEAALAAATAAQNAPYPAGLPMKRLLAGVALLGLHRLDEGVQALSDALKRADDLLAWVDSNVAALQVRALALSALAAATGGRVLATDALQAFGRAHAITSAAGVTADTNQLLKAIASHDHSGVLAEVRTAREQAS
jgi:TPR repeat protein